MKTEALFLFLILLLGLVLCSFLGGNNTEGFSGQTNTVDKSNMGNQSNIYTSGAEAGSSSKYDNYNHYSGSSTNLASGSTYYGPNGVTATVNTNSDGSQSLQIVLPGSTSPMTFSQQNASTSTQTNVESYTNYYGANANATVFYGPNGATATVVTTDNGQQAIKVTTSSGTYYYNTTGANNVTNTSTQYYGSTGYTVQQAPYATSYQGPYGGSAGTVTGPQGNTAYYTEGPAGTTVAGTTATGTTSINPYYSSLPQGIPRSQIPPGQEDLYILKSEVVPPVCPACPAAASCPRQEPCPPCPACARCPEPSFECKKVPNYNVMMNNDYLPTPVLNDFSQFGM